MKTLLALALTAAATASAWAATTPLTLDFDGVGSFASVNAFYNGGTDSDGNVGPALGVMFGADALGLQNDALGPYFSNAPSALGVMTPVGTDATMNVAAGFEGALSFFYSSFDVVADAVQVWGGLNATGPLLASVSLAANANNGCADTPLCNFDLANAAFAGTAYSVSFGGAANSAVFDNIGIDAVAPVSAPATSALVALALSSLALTRSRR